MPFENRVCSICGEESETLLPGENGKQYCKKCIKEHNLIKCSHDGCSKYLKNDEVFLSGRGFLCQNHWDEEYSWCADCGALIQKRYAHRMANGSYVCEHCFEASYFTCHCCGEAFPADEAINVAVEGQSVKICKTCREEWYVECENCGRLIHKSDLCNATFRKKDGHIDSVSGCRGCIEKVAHQCGRCGCWFDKSIPFKDGEHCDGCYYKNEIIHGYTFKPKAEPRKADNENVELLFGVENEIELKFNSPQRYRYQDSDNEDFTISTDSGEFNVDYKRFIAFHIDTAIPGFFYQKHDGSIGYGMEIVSHPATLQFWRSQKDNIEKLFSFLRSEGCEGDAADTVGMHIHVSRNKMKRAHQNAFAAFVYSHGKKIETLAGRKSNRYTKMIALPNSAADSEETRRFERVVINNDDRYSAVNWRNKNTVELRMFQSTLNTNHFLANLEFSDALYHFTRERTVLECVNKDSWHNFTVYASENGYQHLMDLLNEKSIAI